MVRRLSEAESRPTTRVHAVQAHGLQVRAGRHLAVTGRVVWQGTPAASAERGGTGDPGDSAAERGCAAVIRQARREAGA